VEELDRVAEYDADLDVAALWAAVEEAVPRAAVSGGVQVSSPETAVRRVASSVAVSRVVRTAVTPPMRAPTAWLASRQKR
jgi:hypothetical protein